MTNEQTIEAIMKSARARITSENATPVTVARMPAEEVAALLDEIERLKAKLAELMPLYEKPQPADEPARPEPVEWIEWKGGECPIADDARIDVKCRDGDVLRDCLPSNLYWSHHADGNYWGDIVAYRVMA